MIATLILSTVFRTAPTDINKLAHEFVKQTGKPFVLAPLGTKTPSIDIKYEEFPELTAKLAVRLACDKLSNPKLAAFGFALLPDFLLQSPNELPSYIHSFPTDTKRLIKHESNTWSLTALPKLYARAGDIGLFKFSLPIRVHWLLQDLRFMGVVSEVDERTLLDMIAQSIGGRLQVTKRNLDIVLDGEAIRRRWIGTLRLKRKDAPERYLQASFDFAIEALGLVPSTDIVRLFHQKNNRLLLPAPSAGLLAVLAEKLLHAFEVPGYGSEGRNALIGQINRFVPPQIAIQTNGSVNASFQGKSPKDRIEL